MKIIIFLLLAATLACTHVTAQVGVGSENRLVVLSYHDVVKRGEPLKDEYAITVDQLAAQFSWLRQNGYRVVSLDDVFAAKRGERVLPTRAVMLTFDDGLVSVHQTVFPLLRLFNYPALVALVGRWLTDDGPWPLSYGSAQLNREQFLSAAQVSEMARSSLVEFISHSYDLHRGIEGNEVGHLQPAAITRRWHVDPAKHESTAQHQQRIERDLRLSVRSIQALTGRAPRAMAWPYGEYSGTVQRVAHQLGMGLNFSLHGGSNLVTEGLVTLHRDLIQSRTTVPGFAALFGPRMQEPVRFTNISIHPLLNIPAAQLTERLDILLERTSQLGATHTLISMSEAEPIERQVALLNRLAWQLRSRIGVRVLLRWSDRAGNEAEFARIVEHVPLSGILFDVSLSQTTVGVSAKLIEIFLRVRPDDDVAVAVDVRSIEAITAQLAAHRGRFRTQPALILSESITGSTGAEIASRAQDLARRTSFTTWVEVRGDFSAATADQALCEAFQALQRSGAIHFGWNPDDYLNARPSLAALTPIFSRRSVVR